MSGCRSYGGLARAAAVSPPGSSTPLCTVLMAYEDHICSRGRGVAPRSVDHFVALLAARCVAFRCIRSTDPDWHPVSQTTVIATRVAEIMQIIWLDYVRTIGDSAP